jgi:exodeoxyribonuclease V alpha subunit
MEKISGFVDSILYMQEENGFCVAKMQTKESSLLTIVGVMPSIRQGESIECMGEYIHHKTFGKQFSVKEYHIKIPQDVIGIQKYLESGLVKGIGPVYAKKIVEKFKEKTLDVIDEKPYLLETVAGIGKKRIQKIISCWQEQKSIRDLIVYLKTYDVGPSFAQKIFKIYKEMSIQKIKENPYRLSIDIKGIGFKIADNIAIKMGFEKTSPMRIEAGIEHILFEMTGFGHTCFPKERFIHEATKVLDVDDALIEKKLEEMIDNKKVVKSILQDHEFIWLKSLYFYENMIATRLVCIKNAKASIRDVLVEKAITWAQEKHRIKLAENQMIAVEMGVSKKIHVITGGPGTGKSTITKAILSITEKVTDKIYLAAPTGRAAKRMMEITYKKAFTIHSLLEFDFRSGGFKRNEKNPLKCNLLIIDESSMIDTLLMYHLLKAIPDYTRIIFIGDIDQLPSVGPGNVLKDMINSKIITVTYLDKIFRQSKYSHIVVNAHKINKGEFPFLNSEDKKSDFFFHEFQEPVDIHDKIISLLKHELPQNTNFKSLEDIQVLSPMKKGIIGIENLNLSLQKALNPSKNPLVKGGKIFHVKDKVMQIKNNYDKEVFNGDIGKIVQIDLVEQEVIVSFDNKMVAYDFTELDELVLAYAVSIHKYQGSECPCIIVPIHTTHFKMLYKNLLYTAITRGKKLVILLGSKKAIAIAINNKDVHKRFTGLEKALIKEDENPSKKLDLFSYI